jgi:RNA polymerase sigma-70 factor (ECF subfamily)
LEHAELIAAARGGDRKAFEELVRQTYLDTYNLALRLTGNEEDARDVVQEAYLRAWKAMKRFRGDAAFSTWLYRITANSSYTLMTKRRRDRVEPLDESAVEIADTRPGGDPQQAAELAGLQEELTEAVAALPPKLRAVVVLRDVYDLSHEDIADELGISVPAAKVRLHRARKQLRDTLFEERGRSARAV